MQEFIKDQRGTTPVFAAIFIACAITLGSLFAQATSVLVNNPTRDIRVSVSACTNHVLGATFGRYNCGARTLNVRESSIVFVKAR